VFGYPVNCGGRFGQQQRPGYTVATASAGIDVPVSERLRGTIELGWESTIPDSIGRLTMSKRRIWISRLTFVFDTRDERLNPRRGILYRSAAEIGVSRTSVSDQNRRDRQRYELDLEQFFPLGPRQAIALGFHGAAIQSDDPVLPISEKLWLGGARSIRGYREEQFPASRMAWMNLELRHLLGPRSRAFFFLDGGYYADRRTSGGSGHIRRVEDIKWGYGCGVRLEVRTGIIGIDYGLGEGDRFLDGKIHVGIVNSW
jgi:outer membrane protein insertion porin family